MKDATKLAAFELLYLGLLAFMILCMTLVEILDNDEVFCDDEPVA